jgi:hypothetical protein
MRIQDRERFAHPRTKSLPMLGNLPFQWAFAKRSGFGRRTTAAEESDSAIIQHFALKSSFFMSLGACGLKRRILVVSLALAVGAILTSCGGSPVKQPPSGLLYRVLASQDVTSAATFGGLIIVDAESDILTRAHEITAGTSPTLMAISPQRNILGAFDWASNAIYGVNTANEANIGKVQLQGETWSFVVPTANPIAYAAVPSATVQGYSFVGALDVMNLSTSSMTTTIAVPSAETVVSNANGDELLVFSNDSNSVTVISPSVAVPPVDTSCLTNTPPVCTVIPGFDRPVYAVVNGTTAYIFNCGAECGGTQASIQTLDLGTLAVGTPIPVNGATFGMISGTNLYVAGNGSPTGQTCASLPNSVKTAATYCGTLDIVDLTTMTDPYYNNPTKELVIPDGYHDVMDLGSNGQLFIGSYGCTNIGNVNNPVGEVRGCLAIYNTNDNQVIIPPDNGDVDDAQSFVSRYVEYVAQGGVINIYNTTTDVLFYNQYEPYLQNGTIPIVGYIYNVKAIDFF